MLLWEDDVVGKHLLHPYHQSLHSAWTVKADIQMHTVPLKVVSDEGHLQRQVCPVDIILLVH